MKETLLPSSVILELIKSEPSLENLATLFVFPFAEAKFPPKVDHESVLTHPLNVLRLSLKYNSPGVQVAGWPVTPVSASLIVP